MPEKNRKMTKQTPLPDLDAVLKSRLESPTFGYATLEEQGDALQKQANAAIAKDISRGAPDISRNILSKQANTIINLYGRAKELMGRETEPMLVHRSDIPASLGGVGTNGFAQIDESRTPARILPVTALGLTDTGSDKYIQNHLPPGTATHELGHVLDNRDPKSTTDMENHYHLSRGRNFGEKAYKTYLGAPTEMVAERFRELIEGNDEIDIADAYNRAVERKNNRLLLRSNRKNFTLDEKVPRGR